MSNTPELIRQVNAYEETSIVFSGDWTSPEATILLGAWQRAMALDHKLPRELQDLEGMSGKKYRYTMNNIVGSIPDARYLEIGVCAGSTTCSAIWGNKCKVLCIDNWSEWGGPKDAFFNNINYCKTDDIDFSFIESDYKQVDFSSVGQYNVYMYDGPHTEQDQYDAIDLVEPALDDVYILAVDDYNWGRVRQGTERALEKCGHKVLAKIEVRTCQVDEVHPVVSHQFSDWHNGYLLAVVSKK